MFLCSLFHKQADRDKQPSAQTVLEFLNFNSSPSPIVGDSLDYQAFGPAQTRLQTKAEPLGSTDVKVVADFLSETGRWVATNAARSESGRVSVYLPPKLQEQAPTIGLRTAKLLDEATIEPLAEPPLGVRVHRSLAPWFYGLVGVLRPASIVITAKNLDSYLVLANGSLYLLATDWSCLEHTVAMFNRGRERNQNILVTRLPFEPTVGVHLSFQKLYNRLVKEWMASRDLSSVLMRAQTHIMQAADPAVYLRYARYYV